MPMPACMQLDYTVTKVLSYRYDRFHKLCCFNYSLYVRLCQDGQFKVYREYDSEHHLKLEIAYHVEPKLDKSGSKVLHIHTYDKDFNRSKARPLTDSEYSKYKKYFKGVKK